MARNMWDDPYRTGFAGTYDPGTMYGLILRSQRGDNAAKNHLYKAGFYDQYGNGLFDQEALRNGSYQGAVNQWAQARKLGQYAGPAPFQWNQAWASGGAGFDEAWNAAYAQDQGQDQGQARTGTGQSGQQQAQNTPVVGKYGGSGRWGAVKTGNGANFTFTGPNGQRYDWRTGWGDHAAVVNLLNGMGLGNEARSFAYHLMTQANRNISGHNTQRPVDAYMYDLASAIANGMDPNAASAVALNGLRTRYGSLRGTGFDALEAQPAQGNGGAGAGGNGAGNGAGIGGGASGGSAPGTDPGGAGGGQGSTGRYTAIQQALMANDPDLALSIGMRNQGYDINSPGLLNNFIKNRFGSVLEGRVAAEGADGTSGYLDQIDRVVEDFAKGLVSRGGNFYGDMRAAGQRALAGGRGYLNQLSDQGKAAQYVQQMQGLIHTGSNDLVQQALSDVLKRDVTNFGLYSFDNEGAGKNIDPFMEWWSRRPTYGLF